MLSPGATGSMSKSVILRCMRKAGMPKSAEKMNVMAHLMLIQCINKIKTKNDIYLRMLPLLFLDI